MFGLFQADLPIGNRLWLGILALAVAGALASTPLLSSNLTPVEFVTNVLSLYGQASFLEGLLLIPLAIIFVPIDYFIIAPRQSKLHPFYIETERNISWLSRFSEFLSPLLFVLAVVWSVNNQIDPLLAALGIFGLLFGELFQISSFYRDAYEFLSVKQRVNKQTLNAQLTSKRVKRAFRFKAEWIDTIVFLCDNKWEIIEITEQAEQGVLHAALLRRKYRHNLFGEIFRKESLFSQEFLKDDIDE